MRLADVRFERGGNVAIARLAGEVDPSNADELGAALTDALTNEVHVLVLDLTDVVYFDSAGIHLLFDLRNRLRTRGQELRLVVPSGVPARDALRLSGVLSAMPVTETAEEAAGDIAPA